MAITSKKTEKEVFGIVTGCELLNVRSRANSNSEIVNVIPKDTKVSIDPSTIGNKFYKIKMELKRTRPLNDEIVDGYCMSNYISIIDDTKRKIEGSRNG